MNKIAMDNKSVWPDVDLKLKACHSVLNFMVRLFFTLNMFYKKGYPLDYLLKNMISCENDPKFNLK